MHKNIPPEDLPLRESTGAIKNFGWDAKRAERGPSIKYAYRSFLKSNVGKRWDDIYSKICKGSTNKDSARLYKYIRENYKWMVEFDITKKEDGSLVDSKGEPFKSYWRRSFYVLNGILCSDVAKSLKYHKPIKKFREIGGKNYIKYEDIWYEFEYESYYEKQKLWIISAYDLLFKRQISQTEAWAFYGRCIVAITKSQLSSKEIKRLGLNK